MIKVSVVVPVYNPGPYIRACVDSLTAQTLPAEEFEVILVDDGSTDDTPAYLDEVAAAHPNLTVVHQENSGWPGQPRNRGIDLARGEYVMFCDNDDWFGVEALERLYGFATACGSDVVLPKMAGLGRPVPHHVFAETVRRCSLADAPLMDSLTPHKLFRRAFLDEHRIRFPEGRRRLEDHLFVVTAYLLASVVSIYADYTCYFHIRREDSSNAGFRKIDWPGYFANLEESLAVVEAHTEPGEFRDAIFRRWLQVEMVNRLSGGRRARMSDEEAADLLAAAQPVAARHFGEGVVELMPLLSRYVGRAIIAGDGDKISTIADQTAPWTIRPVLLQLGWVDGRLQLAGTVQLTDQPLPEPVPADPTPPGRILQDTPGEGEDPTGAVTLDEAAGPAPVEPEPAAQPPDEEETEETEEIGDLQLAARYAALFETDPELTELRQTLTVLDLTERRTGARWTVPATFHRTGLYAAFTAEIDPDTMAAGDRLPDGLWDLHAQYGVLGLSQRRRVTLIEERRPAPVLPEPTTDDEPPTVVAYFTAQTAALCLDVGLLKHKALRRRKPAPAPEPPPAEDVAPPTPPAKTPPTLARRVRRRLTRMVSD